MHNKFHFTFDNIKEQYSKAIDHDYKIITCKEYIECKNQGIPKLLINRVDIDFSVKKAERLGLIFNELGIKASFFIRLHAPEYNPFSFENYRIIKFLIESGHEIGYHSEIIDQSIIWNEDPEKCLLRDIDVINKMFGVKICGVASHGGMTGFNNLDFWKGKKASDFGLLYEAYDWFDKTFYISDSEWTRWKCYDNGKLIENDRRSLGEHVLDNHRIIYSLIHSDTYYKRHFYE
ncbi:hypothetical protein [Desulfobacula sp.]|uniref:hypothetical protein n=1 Tax=Desulfobacula sp. TaxID=2593537 RepID=UPI0025C01BD1|nr:hypothetical protein [Desulfobacula sp.]MBC2704238.1 hypothetical protein [Desulfobacula sp.]